MSPNDPVLDYLSGSTVFWYMSPWAIYHAITLFFPFKFEISLFFKNPKVFILVHIYNVY